VYENQVKADRRGIGDHALERGPLVAFGRDGIFIHTIHRPALFVCIIQAGAFLCVQAVHVGLTEFVADADIDGTLIHRKPDEERERGTRRAPFPADVIKH